MQVELRQIHKRFGTNHALKGIDLSVQAGTIHGLVGENGAGKSTLMKILTGYLTRTEGRIFLDGGEVDNADPASAARNGIGMLYQEPQDFPPLTVLENFMVGRDTEPDPDRNRQRRRLLELADQVHFSLDPDQKLDKLTVGERQQLELLRLLGRGVQVLILDEPTTGISDRQKARLFEALRQIRDQGRTILLVSHKLEDVVALCDRVTVLRHGRVTGAEDAPFNVPGLLAMMFDAPPANDTHRQSLPAGEVLLSFEQVTAEGERTGLQDCSLDINQGEVVGLAGLSGSGQGLFLRLAAALLKPATGRIQLRGVPMDLKDHRFFKGTGGVFLPADRLEEGLIPGFTIQDHFALASNSNMAAARVSATEAIVRFRIRGEPDTPVESLSGGNQQRLLLSLIRLESSLILLENPTRGLDVESARWIWENLRRQFIRRGAIVFSSAELDEILEVADRVLVFYDGNIVRDLHINELDYQDVAAAMTGR
ncbi:MAG: ATP-binding cassette domain-containing protein [Gammaproteobacteria bacterium]|nr:ATP-binding cassette domain-containing protein [Gammaproteobacteria bacterium]